MKANQGKALFKKAIKMCGAVGDNFIELARLLATIHAEDRPRFDQLIADGHIGRRRAYYLIRLDLLLVQVKDEERLRRIGWTKLSIIVRYANGKNLDELLKYAETHTAHELALVMAGKSALPDSRCMLFYFSIEEHQLVEKALLTFGAKKRGKGLVGKEAALVAALTQALQHDPTDGMTTLH